MCWLLAAAFSALTYAGLARDWPMPVIITTFGLIPCTFSVFWYYAFYRQ